MSQESVSSPGSGPKITTPHSGESVTTPDVGPRPRISPSYSVDSVSPPGFETSVSPDLDFGRGGSLVSLDADFGTRVNLDADFGTSVSIDVMEEVVNEEEDDDGALAASESSMGPKRDRGRRRRTVKSGVGGRRRKMGGQKGQETYRRYLRKVLKQIDPEVCLTWEAMNVMNSLMRDVFDKLASQASRLACSTKKSTIDSREIQSAVKLTFSGELAKHALMEGYRAVMKSRR